ncbi:MAG: SRPBCC domain-containing protein [Chloroflexi bacterium]|nr:SRPBCC domain-containing protein [Chloroflexota bacterium]
MSQQLIVEQHVAAEPARVYAGWTSAEGLAPWWWPHIPDTTFEVEARVAGRYEIRSEAAGIGVRGEFLELDEPSSIRMTWCWLNDGVSEVEDQVHLTFIPQDGGTQVTLRHDLPAIAGEGEAIRQGWRDVLARLAQTCATG